MSRLGFLLPDRYRPWEGRATRDDKLLMGAFVVVVLLGAATKPLTPFLLASHPVVLELLTGDLVAVGAAAAFARVGEAPLWLVVAAGTAGMIKFDWLMWWAGRSWGEGIVRMLTTPDRARAYAVRAKRLDPWVIRLAVLAAVLPGIPTPVVYAMAGLARMRLSTFLVLDALGAAIMTGLVSLVGYELGQHAVDVVLVVDRYASIASLTVIGVMFAVPAARGYVRRLRRRRRNAALPDGDAARNLDETSDADARSEWAERVSS